MDKDKKIWWPFGVIGLVSLVGLVAFVNYPPPIEEGSSLPDAGTWFQVRPPPHAPKGVECWIWKSGDGSAAVGGPTCFVPE